MKRSVIFLILICAFHTLHVYPFLFKHYNSISGLSNDNVYEIVQDSSGYIWIASANGLNKLGPNGLKKYFKKDGLYASTVLSLDIDDRGRLWIGTIAGLCYMENDRIIQFRDDKMFNRPVDLIVYEDYIYFIDQSGGLFIYNRKEDRTSRVFDLVQDVDEGYVRKICKYGRNQILAATHDGLFMIEGNKISPIIIHDLHDHSLYNVYKQINGEVWISSYSNLYMLSGIQNNIANIKFQKGVDFKVKTFAKDVYGKIWYSGLSGGAYTRMDYEDVAYDINDALGMNTAVNSIFIDHHNNIWLGTFGRGIYVVKNIPFQYYDNSKGLSSNYTTDIVSDTNFILVGTNLSFNYLLKGDSIFRELRFTRNSQTEYIRNICPFGDEYLVSIFNQELINKPIITTTLNNKRIHFFNGRYVYGDFMRQVVLLDNYTDSLIVMKPDQDNFRQFKKIGLISVLGNDAHLNRIKRIKSGYWVCTRKGLLHLDIDLNIINVYFKGISVVDITLLGNDILVSGEFGLLKYNIDSRGSQVIFDQYGNPMVGAKLSTINENSIMISSSSGIFIYDNGQLSQIGAEDGLPSLHVSNFTMDWFHNRIWLSTYDGAVSFNKSIFSDSLFTMKANKFIIEEVKGGGRLLSPDGDKTISRNIQITLALFDYLQPNDYFIRYKVDDYGWIHAKGNYINISNTAPGYHTILIQASEDGYSWTYPVSYSYYVIPYWYQKLWVQILFVFLTMTFIAAIIFVFIKNNAKKAHKKIMAERNTMDLKMQALNAAINSHFVFNVLNAIQYFVSSKQDKKASKFIADFARFMRMIIDNSNMTIIPISEEIKRIHLYIGLEMMRFESRLSYEIEIDDSINQEEVMIPNMVIQPFVENSILHGILPSSDNGSIRIELRDLDKYIQLTITDDGIGIDAARQRKKLFNKKSIGLKNVIQRLSLFSGNAEFNYRIIDRSIEGNKGTKVEITFPKITFNDL